MTGVVIAFYVFAYWLIRIKKYYLYALICGNVFFVFIAVTSLMAGFNTGFHFYLVGLCIVSFFTSYFSKSKDIKGSIVWVGLSLAIYLTLYLVSQFNEPYYRIEKWLEITLFSTNAVVRISSRSASSFSSRKVHSSAACSSWISVVSTASTG